MGAFIGVLREMRKVPGRALFFLVFGRQSPVFSCVRKWYILFNDTTFAWLILSEKHVSVTQPEPCSSSALKSCHTDYLP